MHDTRVHALNRSLQKTTEWLKEINKEMRWQDDNYEKAYRCLRAVLHTLRDCLIPQEALDLSAQLPLVLRGTYLEGWTLRTKHEKLKNAEDFYMRVEQNLVADEGIEAEKATHAVLIILERHVTKGEIDHIKGNLPHKMADIFVKSA